MVVFAADAVGEAIRDLEGSQFEILKEDLVEVRMKISKIFKKHDLVKEMGFGI